MKTYPLFLSFLMLFSCSSDRKPATETPYNKSNILDFNSFPNEKSLHGENVGPVESFNQLVNIIYSKNFILVLDVKGDYYFKLLDSELQIVETFGRKGDGPNEIPFEPKISKHDFITLGAIYFYYYGKSEVVAMKIDSSGDVFPNTIDHYPLPEQLYNVQRVVVVEEDKMVGNAGMSEGKLYYFNPEKENVLGITPFYPKLNFQIDKENLIYNFAGQLAASKSQNTLVCANTYFPQLEIYNLDGELKKEIRTSNLEMSDYHRSIFNHFYYYGVQVTDKYIYALYLGEKQDNILQQMLHSLKSKVHVFDLEGSPVISFRLDRLINDFLVDEEHHKIIGIDEDNESQPLVKYDLPKNLQ
ncbi:MAG: BF3164 family lipoprotein [Saprospiraceae bacterium]